jgi:hypothetical protein
MYQYIEMIPEYIETPNGGTKNVIGFRKRNVFIDMSYSKVMQSEMLRVDFLGNRLIGDSIVLTNLIDANDKDIFSFVENETIYVGLT